MMISGRWSAGPSAAVTDAQSVKATDTVNKTTRIYDADKKAAG